jgi:hypothetical protein
MSDLRVELLYTLDCPHYEAVRLDLHRILSEGSIETPIQLVMVGGLDDAEFLDFHGSPTVRLNGEDVLPTPPDAPVSLACRGYTQGDGSQTGRVPTEALRMAIKAHRQGRLEAFRREESARVATAALEAEAEDGASPDANRPTGRS